MAGVGSLSNQVALVAELRWRLFRNALRTSAGQLEMIARVLVAVLAGVGALGIGLTLGVLAYVAVDTQRLRLFDVLAWGIFACWLVLPVMLAGMGIAFDFRNLLHFPLRFSSFVTLSLLYGLLDPPSVVALFWTGCVAAGVALARPRLLPGVLLVLLVFTLVNLLLNRVFLSWLGRVLARRRTREALLAVFLLTMVGLQLIGALAERWEDKLRPRLRAAAPLLSAMPPGAAGESLKGIARGEAAGTIGDGAILLAYAAAAGLLLRRWLRAQYLGEEISEGAAIKDEQRATTEGWQLPGVSNTVAAMCEKELRYVIRNGMTWMLVVMAVFMAAFFSLTWNQQPQFMRRSAELFFPGAAAYCLLLLAPLLNNTFAFEGKGLQLLLVLPVRLRDVILAKNVVNGALIFGTVLMTWAVPNLWLVPPRPGIVVMTFSALLPLTLACLMAGNALSLYFPRKIEIGTLRNRASQVNVLLGLLCQLVLLGSAAIIAHQARSAAPNRWPWLASVIFLALSAPVAWVYRASLNWSAQVLLERRETLLAELSR